MIVKSQWYDQARIQNFSDRGEAYIGKKVIIRLVPQSLHRTGP